MIWGTLRAPRRSTRRSSQQRANGWPRWRASRPPRTCMPAPSRRSWCGSCAKRGCSARGRRRRSAHCRPRPPSRCRARADRHRRRLRRVVRIDRPAPPACWPAGCPRRGPRKCSEAARTRRPGCAAPQGPRRRRSTAACGQRPVGVLQRHLHSNWLFAAACSRTAPRTPPSCVGGDAEGRAQVPRRRPGTRRARPPPATTPSPRICSFPPTAFSRSSTAALAWTISSCTASPSSVLRALDRRGRARQRPRRIDDLMELALGKVGLGQTRTLAERPATQAAVARAERPWKRPGRSTTRPSRRRGRRRARARSGPSCGSPCGSRGPTPCAPRRGRRSMYDLGGSTEIYEHSPLQRRFRDADTATAHSGQPSDVGADGAGAAGPPGRTEQLSGSAREGASLLVMLGFGRTHPARPGPPGPLGTCQFRPPSPSGQRRERSSTSAPEADRHGARRRTRPLVGARDENRRCRSTARA